MPVSTVRVQMLSQTPPIDRLGTPVPSRDVGVRTFLDGSFGVALVAGGAR